MNSADFISVIKELQNQNYQYAQLNIQNDEPIMFYIEDMEYMFFSYNVYYDSSGTNADNLKIDNDMKRIRSQVYGIPHYTFLSNFESSLPPEIHNNQKEKINLLKNAIKILLKDSYENDKHPVFIVFREKAKFLTHGDFIQIDNAYRAIKFESDNKDIHETPLPNFTTTIFINPEHITSIIPYKTGRNTQHQGTQKEFPSCITEACKLLYEKDGISIENFPYHIM